MTLAGMRWTAAIEVTNGPAFSPDGKIMYHNDSARQLTYVFDLDATGSPASAGSSSSSTRATVIPDGMTVDSEGCLWIALWDGWCVRRYSPGGEWLETLKMPVARPTSCAFGGLDLDRLYITSASIGLDASCTRDATKCRGVIYGHTRCQGASRRPLCGLTT